jgi:hypothetical protein
MIEGRLGYSPEEDAKKRADEIESVFSKKAVKHLNSWDKKQNKLREEADLLAFKTEEEELLAIEKVRTLAINDISSDEFIGKQQVESSSGIERVSSWGELIQFVESVIQKNGGQINILVAGLPISGKATVRRLFAKSLGTLHGPNEVSNIDRDYIKMPKDNLKAINVIEDMHGLESNYGDINYDLVVYIKPTQVGHLDSIRSRGQHWVADSSAKVDLTDGVGSAGAAKLERMSQAAGSMAKAQNSREIVFAEDAPVLDELKESGASVITLDPAVLLEKAYPRS